MLRFERIIPVIDAHAGGGETRVVIGGFPYIPGNTMLEKREYFKKQFDHIRTTLTQDPRPCSVASIVTAPAKKDCDFGQFFIDAGGYIDACGNGTMCTVAVLIQTGMIPAREPITEVVLDTPDGPLTVKAEILGNEVAGVTIQMEPSFYCKSATLNVPELGKLPIDIAFGGNFFVFVKAEEIGIEVKIENADRLARIAWDIFDAANEQVSVQHPQLHHKKSIDLVQIWGNPTVRGVQLKNATTGARRGTLAKAPCGTGLCATMATLHYKGIIALGQEVICEGLLGTTFTGKIIGETKIGERPAVIPEITGRAHITAISHVVIEPEDPLKFGFSLHQGQERAAP